MTHIKRNVLLRAILLPSMHLFCYDCSKHYVVLHNNTKVVLPFVDVAVRIITTHHKVNGSAEESSHNARIWDQHISLAVSMSQKGSVHVMEMNGFNTYIWTTYVKQELQENDDVRVIEIIRNHK